MIPLHAPQITSKDVKKVNETMRSGWVSTSGELINTFETELSRYTKSKYCIAVSSGTSALHLSLLAIKIEENDEVIVPSVTFIAPVNTINYLGAKPIFMDVDNYLNIDSIKVIDFLNKSTYQKNGYTYNIKSKRRIKAIIVVHVFGNPANIEELLKICRKKNIECVEDTAEGLGSFYSKGNLKNRHVGTIGRIGCLSFNGNKIITTGAGGAVITNSKSLYKKVKYLSTQAKDDDIKYIHNEVGYNYRMPNILAALGITQLKSLEENLSKKRKINSIYKKEFAGIKNVKILSEPNYGKSNYWLNVIIFRNFNKKKYLNEIIDFLNKKGIQARPIWKPNHLQKPYLDSQSFKIKNANKFYLSCLCLPSSSNLSYKEIVYIAKVIKSFLKKINY